MDLNASPNIFSVDQQIEIDLFESVTGSVGWVQIMTFAETLERLQKLSAAPNLLRMDHKLTVLRQDIVMPGRICSLCGNKFIELAEECDDGNLINGDKCDKFCYFEPYA